MNEKTFEEQFPSIKDKCVFTEELSYISLTKGSVKIYLQDTIKECCLDKQRVIEVINKYVKCDCKLFPKYCELHKILKELGL